MRLDEWQRYINSEFVEDQDVRAGTQAGQDRQATPTVKPTDTVPAPAEDTTASDAAAGTEALREAEPNPSEAAEEAPPSLFAKETDASDPDGTQTASAAAVETSALQTVETTSAVGIEALTRHTTEAVVAPEIESPQTHAAAPAKRAPAPTAAPRTIVEAEYAAPEGYDEIVLPFAEYISVGRRPANAQTGSLKPSSDSVQDALAAAPNGPDGTLALELTPLPRSVSDEEPPLMLASKVLSKLGFESDAGAAAADASGRSRRGALVRRILNPVLSIDETAILLGLSAASVQDFADRGLLRSVSCDPESKMAEREDDREAQQRRYSLSDIARFIENQNAVISKTPAQGNRQDEESQG